MTPLALGLFLLGVFAIRQFGGFALAGLLGDSELAARLLNLLPMAIVAAVIASQIFTTGRNLVLDARIVGLVVAVILSWKKLPIGLVVIFAAAATAGVRAAGWG